MLVKSGRPIRMGFLMVSGHRAICLDNLGNVASSRFDVLSCALGSRRAFPYGFFIGFCDLRLSVCVLLSSDF